ncbi:DUF3942 family protein [Bacillus cereus]|uniref:DUF3942 family protein n=1 Tax=Bacillus cereus TaxID=1396 RepID=UPI00356FE578
MSFPDEFAIRIKEYLEDEKDKKIIKNGYRDVIFQYLYELEVKIGVVKNPNFNFFTSGRRSHIVVENIEFKTEVHPEKNIIEITKIVDKVVTPLDTIIVKNGELFALGCNEKFTTEILEGYLRETFSGKLGFSLIKLF